MLDLFGDSEYSLRAFPLLVGVGSLILFYLVVRELLTPVGSLVALLLFATIEPFVRYSAEAKQYGLDVAITLGLLYLFVRLVETGELSRWSTLLLAVVGPLAVSLSHPSAFVLSGLAIGGLYVAVSSRSAKGLIRQSIAYGIWLVSFLVVYLVAIRDLSDLQDTVRGVGATTGDRVKNLYTIFSDPGEFPRTTVGLAATVSLVGIISLWTRRPAVVVVFASTAAAVFVAGALGLYPVGQRFLLFLLPLVVICLAEGITRIGGIRPPVVAIGLLVGLVALILGPCCRHGVETARGSTERRGDRISAPRGGDELAAGRRPLSLPGLAVCVPLLRRVPRLRRCHESSPRAVAFTPDGRGPTADDTSDRVRLAESRGRGTRPSAPGIPCRQASRLAALYALLPAD